MLNALVNRLRAEHGFTLVETLVAMLCGIIISGALFAILEVSLHQTVRTAGRVQATQEGRSTMTKIVDALRNGCIAKEFAPIQENSKETELIFVAGVGQEAVLKKATKHKIVFNAEKGTLVDEQYPSSGEWPKFTFTSPVERTVRLGENIKQTGTTPIFQYYKYASSTTSSSSTSGAQTLTSLSAPLTSSTAPEAASVLISFTVGATEGKQYKPNTELSSQVTLSMMAPSAETPIVAKPCE